LQTNTRTWLQKGKEKHTHEDSIAHLTIIWVPNWRKTLSFLLLKGSSEGSHEWLKLIVANLTPTNSYSENIRRENMVGISSNISLSTVSTYPLENRILLLMRKKPTCNFMVFKSCFQMGRTGIHCKLSGVEDNPTGKNLSLSSTNRMEEYNIAMKRMMRNPYEYHHDLG